VRIKSSLYNQTSDEIILNKGQKLPQQRESLEVSDYTELGYENDINFDIVISPDLTRKKK
jgi:hypothetical protein